MRVHEDDFTDEERAQFNHWLNSDPANRHEFDAMMEVWTISEFLPVDPPVETALNIKAHALPKHRFKRALIAAAMLVPGLPIAALIGWHLNLIPDSYQRFQSDAAIRDVTLSDGSHVQLNLGSQLSFANYKDRRSVTLSKGEAWFEVQHDANHPFLVNAGRGQIRVTGTQFNVWTYQDEVVVTLIQGSVQVMGERSKPDQFASLSPGMRATYDLQKSNPVVSTASFSQALAWRDGKLILDDILLNDALPQINRYLDSPIRLGDRATGQLHIGGIYNTRDINGLVQALPKVLPVFLSRNEEGQTVIRGKRSYAP